MTGQAGEAGTGSETSAIARFSVRKRSSICCVCPSSITSVPQRGTVSPAVVRSVTEYTDLRGSGRMHVRIGVVAAGRLLGNYCLEMLTIGRQVMTGPDNTTRSQADGSVKAPLLLLSSLHIRTGNRVCGTVCRPFFY